jgi:hypothetical protein
MTKNKMTLPDGSTVTFSKVARMVAKPDKIGGETAEQELHRKVQTLMLETKRNYTEAMATVLMLDGELKSRWVRETLTPRRKKAEARLRACAKRR